MTYIIAMDGPSGSGKSTLSEMLAEKLDIEYLNTGLMYRAVTKRFLDLGIGHEDGEIIKEELKDLTLSIENGKIYLNGEDVSKYLRSDDITKNVSWVSANKDVREKLVDLQRAIAKDTSFILDGRDIGTVVFPNAKYKFYITASSRIRALRRYKQNESDFDIDELEEAIIARDDYDSKREISPLKKADDAILIDNSNLSIDETIDLILKKMDQHAI
ncbi:MAG: (d)CMP kinase [Anaerococcus sp.]|nr:(d)CMP kinase [Anaerococcus sp.]